MSRTKIEVIFSELVVFDPQDTGQNARDEPFFLFYYHDEAGTLLKSAATGDSAGAFGKGPNKVNRGPNRLEMNGITYDTMRIEVWEKDGGDYDVKFDEADGTAGSDNRLATFEVSAVPSSDGFILRAGGAEHPAYQTGTTVSVDLRGNGFHYELKLRCRLTTHEPSLPDF